MTTENIQAACAALAQSMLSPEQFGHAVTAEVRDAARKALGRVPVEQAQYLNTAPTINEQAAWTAAYQKLACGSIGTRELWDEAIRVGKFLSAPPAAEMSNTTAALIHYPECWDTAAYPTLASAIKEIGAFKCSSDECQAATQEAKPVAADSAFRSRVADLIHLIQFYPNISKGDERQAELAIVDIKRMLAAAPKQPAPADKDAVLEPLDVEVILDKMRQYFSEKASPFAGGATIVQGGVGSVIEFAHAIRSLQSSPAPKRDEAEGGAA